MSDSDSAGNKEDFTALPKPEAEEPAPKPKPQRPKRRPFDGGGGLFGWLILWFLAAVGGALIVIAWQWKMGGAPADTAVNDRLAALETRVGQIAAGKASKAAEANFAEEQRNLSALKTRLDADEARITALEGATGQTPTTGQAAGDTAALKSAIDKNAADLAQITQQLAKLKPQDTAQLDTRIAANEKTLAGFESKLDAQGKASTDAQDKLSARLAIDEGHLAPADLAQRLDSFALKTNLAALDTRLTKLESQNTAQLVRRASAVLALADFVRASESAAPFASERDTLATLIPASPALSDLSHYAKQGVPTVAMLAERFSQQIDPILAAERAASAHNWAERLWFDFINLVSVRRVGNVAGKDTEARVARAEYDLKNGDLAAAVHEVRGLDAPARKAAASWLKDADARLAVDKDTRALTAHIVTGLADAGKADASQ